MELHISHAMKTFLTKIAYLFTLIPLLLVTQTLSAQYFDILYPGEGYPAMLRYYDGEKMQRMVIADWMENPIWKTIKCLQQICEMNYLNGSSLGYLWKGTCLPIVNIRRTEAFLRLSIS